MHLAILLNTITGVAFCIIALQLLRFAKASRQDLGRQEARQILLVTFLASGLAHLDDVLALWWANDWAILIMDGIAAAVAVATAIRLPGVITALLNLPSVVGLEVIIEAMHDAQAREIVAYRRLELVAEQRLRVAESIKRKLATLEARLDPESHAAALIDLREIRRIIPDRDEILEAHHG